MLGMVKKFFYRVRQISKVINMISEGNKLINMRKNIRGIFLLMFLLITFAGCGEKKESGVTDHSDQSVVIAIGSGSEPEEGLNPIYDTAHGANPLIQSTLVTYDAEMNIHNDLASEYEVSADGRTWTFKIREDAKFTDGEPVKASDVAFTLMEAKESASSIDLTMVEQVETQEDDVIVTLKRPQATFLNTIATLGIVPEHLYNESYGEQPVGSGPFKFVQWNKGEQMILEANEDYYGEVPSIKKVTLVFMDEDAAFAAANAGDVDVALVSATHATKSIDGMRLERVKTQDNRGITLPLEVNTGEKTTDGYPIGNDVTANKAIRQALVYGLDRDEMAENTVNGFAVPAYSENDGMPWHNPEVMVETDVEKAIKILEEDGWKLGNDGILEKDGLKAEFDLYYVSGDSVRQAVALDAASQAEELGIKINVRGSNWDEISKKMFSNAVLMGWGSSNPHTSYLLFHGSNKLQDDYYNPEGFDNETVNQYLEDALKSNTSEEMNDYFKKAQWDGKTGTSMLGEVPWVWLVNIDHLYYVRDGLDIGNQPLHAHGAAWPLVGNLSEWTWENAQ